MSVLAFRASNPRRPVSWRWEYATYLADNNLRIARSRSDAWIARAKHFIRELRDAEGDNDRLVLAEEQPDIFEAYQLYNGTDAQMQRWEIEARLLAGEIPDQIFAKAEMQPSITFAYSQLFFDVVPHLPFPGHITNVVLEAALRKGISERGYDGLWKLFGYWGGPYVLDMLIYKFNSPSRPDGRKSVGAFWTDDIRAQMQMKSALALRMMPINWQTQTELLNLYMRMLELDKDKDSDNAQASYKASIQAFLKQIPWARSDMRIPNPAVDALDQRAQALRSSELMMISNNMPLDDPQLRLIASAVYPTPAGKA